MERCETCRDDPTPEPDLLRCHLVQPWYDCEQVSSGFNDAIDVLFESAVCVNVIVKSVADFECLFSRYG